MKEKLYNMKNANKQLEVQKQITKSIGNTDTSIVQKVGVTEKTEMGIRKIERLDLEYEASQFENNGAKFKTQMIEKQKRASKIYEQNRTSPNKNLAMF